MFADRKSVLPSQQYAMRLLLLLQDFGDELIKVDTVIIVIKMLTRHTVDNAVIFATGDAFQFGAVEFESGEETRHFLSKLSVDVALAAMINGEFEIYKYPYRSQVIDEWIFIPFEPARHSGG